MANKTNRLKKPQVPVVEWTDVQNAPVIATKTSELENDAKFQTKNQVVSEISARYKGAMRYLGQVATKENLPLGPEAGDTYQTMDTKELYCYDGVVWVKVGVTEVPEPPAPTAQKKYRLVYQESRRTVTSSTYPFNGADRAKQVTDYTVLVDGCPATSYVYISIQPKVISIVGEEYTDLPCEVTLSLSSSVGLTQSSQIIKTAGGSFTSGPITKMTMPNNKGAVDFTIYMTPSTADLDGKRLAMNYTYTVIYLVEEDA